MVIKDEQRFEVRPLEREQSRGREDRLPMHTPSPSTPLSSTSSNNISLLTRERMGREKEKESFPPSAFAPSSYTTAANSRQRSRSRTRSLGPASSRTVICCSSAWTTRAARRIYTSVSKSRSRWAVSGRHSRIRSSRLLSQLLAYVVPSYRTDA